jgi:pyruvate dehydrogenase E2 component (dihydrolipoamide acetyltransferase)
MATKVVMEALSPTMEEGRLVKWLKNEGDAVKSGEAIAEVETDKAIMELVARADGVLRKRLVNEGDAKPVGELVGVIAGADEDISAIVGGGGASAPAAAPASSAQAQGGGDAKGGGAPAETVVAETRERAGATSVPRTPDESQGDASMPPQEKAPAGGGQPASAPPPRGSGTPAPATEQAPHGDENGGRQRSSPLARRLASERGLDLGQVRGSGPGGRIVKRDIEQAASQPAAAAASAAPRAASGTGAEFEDVPLSQMRKVIARRLAESIGPVPTFYLTSEFDLERVAEMRTAMAAMGDEYKVSFNDVIMKATATALSRHPEVNAHWMGDRIRHFNRVHLGMAVAIEDGLITPVIFDAHQKRMSEISAEARALAKRARERRLKPEEYTGATFSVSNLGMFGIDQFTAIINPPEAGILAVGGVEEKPVSGTPYGKPGELVIRKRMRVTMSCDHRVIDGATGAIFLQTLRRLIENPLMLVH